MPIDASIYSQFAPKVVNPLDVQNALSQQASNALAMRHQQLQLQGAQADMSDTNALRDAIRGGADLNTPEGVNALMKAAPLKAQAFLKTQADLKKTAADTELASAHAAEFRASAPGKVLESARSMLPMVQTPQQFGQWVDALYQNPATAPLVSAQFGDPQAVKARIPQDPAEFQTFLQKNAMGMDKFIQDQTSKANNAANNATSVANNAATNKTHIQAAGIAASTSRANNAATIAKDYTIAGIGPDGAPSANVESMAQMIAAGKVAPITGFALARPQGQAVMARVSQINPNYDATTYGAKVKAAKDFGTGQQGNAMRSFAVAGDHLDQLGKLADALNNGNMQIVNTIGNKIAEQTGSPAPSNFDAAKDIVSKEVVKAIVAGGGGVSEREELARLMSNAKSPAQLKGVITQYRNLMAAQHDHLLQQRSAAGLDPATLPSYSTEKPSGHPPEINDLLKKYGK